MLFTSFKSFSLFIHICLIISHLYLHIYLPFIPCFLILSNNKMYEFSKLLMFFENISLVSCFTKLWMYQSLFNLSLAMDIRLFSIFVMDSLKSILIHYQAQNKKDWKVQSLKQSHFCLASCPGCSSVTINSKTMQPASLLFLPHHLHISLNPHCKEGTFSLILATLVEFWYHH